MKKGRNGTLLSVLTPSSSIEALERILFEHSSAIGIRRYKVNRHKLRRETKSIKTEFGPVRIKVVTLPDGNTRCKVEDDDAREAASRSGVSCEEVRRQVDLTFGANKNQISE